MRFLYAASTTSVISIEPTPSDVTELMIGLQIAASSTNFHAQCGLISYQYQNTKQIPSSENYAI